MTITVVTTITSLAAVDLHVLVGVVADAGQAGFPVVEQVLDAAELVGHVGQVLDGLLAVPGGDLDVGDALHGQGLGALVVEPHAEVGHHRGPLYQEGLATGERGQEHSNRPDGSFHG